VQRGYEGKIIERTIRKRFRRMTVRRRRAVFMAITPEDRPSSIRLGLE
jgi:hypothetical protein